MKNPRLKSWIFMLLWRTLDFIVLWNLLKSLKGSRGLKLVFKAKMGMSLTKLQQKLSLIMEMGELKKLIYLRYLQKGDKLLESSLE